MLMRWDVKEKGNANEIKKEELNFKLFCMHQRLIAEKRKTASDAINLWHLKRRKRLARSPMHFTFSITWPKSLIWLLQYIDKLQFIRSAVPPSHSIGFNCTTIQWNETMCAHPMLYMIAFHQYWIIWLPEQSEWVADGPFNFFLPKTFQFFVYFW